MRQHLSYVSGGPFQYAMATGLGLPDEYFAGFRADLAGKRDLLSDGLAALGHARDPDRGHLLRHHGHAALGYADGLAFCRGLPRRAGVVAIPHQAFCDDEAVGAPYVRWAFCKRPAVLEEAPGEADARAGVTILVDDAVWPWRGRMWAHLVSDTSVEELQAFADGWGSRVGLSRATTTT